MTLDEMERIAREAQASYGSELPDWYNGGWSEEAVSPADVLKLIAVARAAKEWVDASSGQYGSLYAPEIEAALDALDQ